MAPLTDLLGSGQVRDIGMCAVSRARIEAAIDALIDMLDELDGDADLEEAGDSEPVEAQGDIEETDAEDSFAPPLRDYLRASGGAGCVIAEAGI